MLEILNNRNILIASVVVGVLGGFMLAGTVLAVVGGTVVSAGAIGAAAYFALHAAKWYVS